MKTQELFLKAAYCLAGLLLLASILINTFQYQQFMKLSKRSVTERITKNNHVIDSNSGSGSPPVNREEESNTNEIDELEYHLRAAEEELDMTYDQLYEELFKKAEYKKAYYQPSRRRSDPVYKKIQRDSITKFINEDYGLLFKKLNISAEEFDEFKDMLFDKRIEIDDLSAPYLNASTAEEKEKVLQQNKEISEKYKNRISDFFGEEQNEIYQDYENRLPERRRLSDFMAGISLDNIINEEQTEILIDSMYDARKSVYDEMGTDENESYSELTEEIINQNIEMQSRIHEKYVEAGRGIMSPEQSEQFKTYLKQQLDMQDASLKMSLYLNEEE